MARIVERQVQARTALELAEELDALLGEEGGSIVAVQLPAKESDDEGNIELTVKLTLPENVSTP